MNADDSNLDWSKTTHTEDTSGDINELAVALMAKDTHGQWTVIAYGIVDSDVSWFGWEQEYKVPQKLPK